MSPFYVTYVLYQADSLSINVVKNKNVCTNATERCIVMLEVINMAVRYKTNRLDLRISDSDKEILDKAAQSNGLTLSSYIVSVALKQAKLDLIQNETIVLANRDRDTLLKFLAESPEPNQALKDLFRK